MIMRPPAQVAKPSNLVCVFNRRRDDYQVPLEEAEAGLLECFVTDLYLGEIATPIWPAPLRRRAVAGLPFALTKSVWSSFLLQVSLWLFGGPPDWMCPMNERMLARAAGRHAKQKRAAL